MCSFAVADDALEEHPLRPRTDRLRGEHDRRGQPRLVPLREVDLLLGGEQLGPTDLVEVLPDRVGGRRERRRLGPLGVRDEVVDDLEPGVPRDLRRLVDPGRRLRQPVVQVVQLGEEDVAPCGGAVEQLGQVGDGGGVAHGTLDHLLRAPAARSAAGGREHRPVGARGVRP
jgi:hypothetical protein